MTEVEIVVKVKVPEGLDPEKIAKKARVLAEWESIRAAAIGTEPKKKVKLTLKGTSREFYDFLEEGRDDIH
ncbi:hypothetical protein [Thermococcus stetteri]|uniref:hypothetical protein n=1 Tax=Thermococcus stetteri TaxID=49900 RepID=UPI001AE24E8F|nr:hypothetical protein [Thermococcus stetteri]MBP1910807.1 hypothetical protein [Thermococcus stetteri]